MATPSNARPSRPRLVRAALAMLIVVWGAQAIVTQSLLLREALVLMYGSEFAWGVVLFAWLLGVALGGAIGGWTARRMPRADLGLIAVLLILSAAACGELWVFRGARAWLGVEPGELLPLHKTALAAVLFVSPASAFVGMAFPLACRIADAVRRDEPPGAGPLGSVYTFESAGSLIGGAAFSFWAVEHMAPIEIALACAVLTTAATAWMLFGTARRRIFGAALAAVAVVVLVLLASAGDALEHRLVLRRWRNIAPGYELCAQAESKYQNLAVGRRFGQYTLYCDGQVSADFPDPITFKPLAHLWMCQHPDPRRVLVLGGGAEGLLAEILKHPVEHVDYIEPDPRQIEIIKPFLAEEDRHALADPRVTVHYVDARYFVKTQRDQFDLVIARLPEPTSALRARLYTDEFFGELRRAMKPRAAFCTTITAPPGELSEVSGEYMASIRATLRRHFPYLIIGWENPAYVLAATDSGLITIDPVELVQRYTQRGVQSDRFDPLWFEGGTDQLDPEKVQRRARELDAIRNAEISTDLRPIIYVQRLMLWDRMTAGQAGRLIEILRSIRWPELIAALAGLAAATLILCRLRGRSRRGWASGAVVLSVATTGFATMALSIVWLFAFQNLYGYVYQRIGWIIAVFMAGLVIGCGWFSRRAKRFAEPTRLSGYLWQWLIAVDLWLALLALCVPFILPVLGMLQTGPLTLLLVEWAVLVMVAATGVLGGAAFALAGGLQLATTGRPESAAGSIVAADHAGACLGALLTGILLVPVFGTPAAAYLLVGIKLVSAAVLLFGWRIRCAG
jgi:spermidine synthase